MSETDVILERETANDEEAVVVTIHVASGTVVEKDEVIFDIENSKATQEVVAPESGVLTHGLEIGQTVSFGVPIARVLSAELWARTRGERAEPATTAPDSGFRSSEPVATAPPPPRDDKLPRRFSHAATALLAEYGLTPDQFTADFVTALDVGTHIGRAKPGSPKPASAPRQPGVDVTARPGQALSRRKQAEIDTLSRGAGNTMLSVLGTNLGPLTVRRDPGDFLSGRITDLVIYEASRLMRKFPRLNAFHAEGESVEHEAVHAGLAIDSGGRLMVYGIENSDRMAFPDLSATLSEAVARYINNELTSAELSRATFTVTDLSADELDFVLPLLPRGQSCILGITHSEQSGFRLFAGFDHRVTEGREVAGFLGELRDRVLSFGTADAPRSAAHCVYCERSLTEAVTKGREKGLLKIVDRDGQDALCCASCWNGW